MCRPTYVRANFILIIIIVSVLCCRCITVVNEVDEVDELAPLPPCESLPTALSELLLKFVVVKYDGHPYPGKVVDIDEQQGELEISCMHRVGQNRFFWPLRTDICWYTRDDILAVIPEPTNVTHRHCEVSPPIWRDILEKL